LESAVSDNAYAGARDYNDGGNANCQLMTLQQLS